MLWICHILNIYHTGLLRHAGRNVKGRSIIQNNYVPVKFSTVLNVYLGNFKM